MSISTSVETKVVRHVNRNTKEYKLSKHIHQYLLENGVLTLPSDELCNAHKARRQALRFGNGSLVQQRKLAREIYGRYAMLTDAQKQEFLKHLRLGMNEAYTADVLKVSWTTYGRTRQGDPEFVKEVDGAKQSAEGMLEHEIFGQGANGSLQACAAFLQLRQRTEQGKFMRKLERNKLKLKEKEINAKVKAVDHIVDQSEGKLDFSVLTNEELGEYARIHELNNSLPVGVELSSEDALIYMRITRKLANSGALEQSTCNGTANGIHKLNGISKIDQMMDEEDDD